jgi:MFS family permease
MSAGNRADLEANLNRFILFRIFFNARFYYPVFTILFLDYGLTLEQFSILNLVWALTIVLAEVPSGALADIIGRKRLLVFAACLMFIEMSLLVFVPVGTSSLLFIVFLANRICSGLAEAAASGADEALAYDSLVQLGRESEWAGLLERTARFMSVAFFINMITGALAYDGRIVNTLLGHLNAEWSLPPETIIRLPVALTLLTSCIVVFTTMRMREPGLPAGGPDEAAIQDRTLWQSVVVPFQQIMRAAGWTSSLSSPPSPSTASGASSSSWPASITGSSTSRPHGSGSLAPACR